MRQVHRAGEKLFIDYAGPTPGAVKVVAAKSSMLKRLVFVFDSDPLVFAG